MLDSSGSHESQSMNEQFIPNKICPMWMLCPCHDFRFGSWVLIFHQKSPKDWYLVPCSIYSIPVFPKVSSVGQHQGFCKNAQFQITYNRLNAAAADIGIQCSNITNAKSNVHSKMLTVISNDTYSKCYLTTLTIPVPLCEIYVFKI